MGRMNRRAYEQMIAEDILWLLEQPRTLERDHIELILRREPDREYPRTFRDEANHVIRRAPANEDPHAD